MRINNLLGGTFLGVLLILVGLAALLRSFNIDIPFGRIIIGLLIIYVGVVFLLGGGIFIPDGNTIIFNSSNIKVTDNAENEYNIIFSSGIIDLTDLNPADAKDKIEINTIFGYSEVLLDSKKNISIDLSSVFGKATAPDGNTVTFGDYKFTNNVSESLSVIRIKSSTVFGGSEIKYIE